MPNARELVTTLEIELDRCVRAYGQAPCTAALTYGYDADGGDYALGVLWGDRVQEGRELGDFGVDFTRVSTANARVEVDDEGVGYWQDNDTEAHYLRAAYNAALNKSYLFTCYAKGTTDTTHPFIFWWETDDTEQGFGLGWLNDDLVILTKNGEAWASTIVANLSQLPPAKRYPVTMVVSYVVSQGSYVYSVEGYITKGDGTILSGSGALNLGASDIPVTRFIVGSGGTNIAHNSWDGEIEKVAVVERAFPAYFTTAERQGWRPETGALRYSTGAQCFNTLATCQDEANYSDDFRDGYQAASGYSDVRYYGVPGDGGTAGFESATGVGAVLAQIAGKTADVARNDDGSFQWNDNDDDKQALVTGGLPMADGDRWVFAARTRRAVDNTYPMVVGVASHSTGFRQWSVGGIYGGNVYSVYLAGGLSLYKWGVSPGVSAQIVASSSALWAANVWVWHTLEVTRTGANISVRATVHDGAGSAGAVATITAAWTDGDQLYFHIGGAAANGYYSWDDRIEQIAIGKPAAALTDAELQGLTAANMAAAIPAKKRRTYKFCTEGVFLPDHWANIARVQDKPAGLKADFTMWQRERVDITLADSPAPDIADDDPYAAARPAGYRVDAQSGGYLARLFARNRHFVGRRAVVRFGWKDATGAFFAADMRNLYIRSFTRDAATDNVRVELDDGLLITDDAGAIVPPESKTTLRANLTAAATGLVLADDPFKDILGEQENEYNHIVNLPLVAGRQFCLRINDELMQVTAVANITGETAKLATVVRGVHGTTAAAHEAGDDVGAAYVASNRNIVEVVRDILTFFCDLRGATIDDDSFNFERDSRLSTFNVSGILGEPQGADVALAELQKSGQFAIWYDSAAGKIKMRSVLGLSILADGATTLTDADLVADSYRIREDPGASVSRVAIYNTPVDPLQISDKAEDYHNVDYGLNQNIERAEARGSAHEVAVYTRWLNSTQALVLIGLILPQGELTAAAVNFALPFYPDRPRLQLGQNVRVQTRAVVDDRGAPRTEAVRVLQARIVGDRQEIQGVRTVFGANEISPFIIGVSRIGGTDVLT